MSPHDYDSEHYDTSLDYYPSTSTFVRQPVRVPPLPHSTLNPLQLNYHLYTNPAPDAFAHNHFISDDIREELQKRSETIQTAPPPGLILPDDIQGYHTLVPLEIIAGDRRKLGNWYSTVYRAMNTKDGIAYTLRRVESMCRHALR